MENINPNQDGGGKKLSPSEFSQKIKTKYPQYKDMDDVELANKMVNKYPEYKDKINFDTPAQPKGVNAEDLTDTTNTGSVSTSANGADYLSVLPQDTNVKFEQPNSDFYKKINKSVSRFKVLRDGSGNVSAYDPEKQTPEFDPRTGAVVFKNNPSGQVSARILEKVKEKAGVSNEVIDALDEGKGDIKYIKDVTDFLRLNEGEFENKTADEVIKNMGIDFDKNAESLKKSISEKISQKPFFEHENKQIDNALNSDGFRKTVGDINKYGFNIEDFNKYLDSTNPRLKKLINDGLIGSNDDLIGSTKTLPTEMQLFKNLYNYTSNRGKYLSKLKTILDYRKENGEDVEEELNKVLSEQSSIKKGLVDYTKDNLKTYTSFIDRKRSKDAEEYRNAKNGESESLFIKTLENVSRGFIGGAQDMVTFISDGLGANEFAEEARLAKEIQDVTEAENLNSFMWETGKEVIKNGVRYGITDEGRILDLDEGLDITTISDKIGIDKNKIIEESKTGNSFNTFSAKNASILGGSTLGNLAFQIMGTKGIGSIVGTGTKAMVASNMVMTGGMVYTSVYEDALQTLRDSNISEKEARTYANEVAIATGSVAALTSIISPNMKAQGMFNKPTLKNMISNAIKADATGGKKAMFKSIKDATIKAISDGSKEGIEEVIQENLEYLTERLVSGNVNDKLGKDVIEEDIKLKDVIDNSVLAFGASSALAGIGSVKESGYSQDKLDLYRLLGQDFDKVKTQVETMVSKGNFKKKDADNLISNVEKFVKYSSKMPKNTPKEKTFDIIDLLDSRNKLEQRKKLEDKAFHPQINEDIKKLDSKISDFMKTPVKKETETVEGEPVKKEIKLNDKEISDVSSKLRSLKPSLEQNNDKDNGETFEYAWSKSLEATAKTLDSVGDINKSVENGMQTLKESEWYKKLSDEGKKKANVLFNDTMRRNAGYKTSDEETKGFFKTKAEELIDNLSEKLIDKYHKVHKAVGKVTDGSNPNTDYYTAQKLTSGKTASSLEVFDNEIVNISKEYTDLGLDHNLVSDYMYAKHAKERNAYIKNNVDSENNSGSGITDAEADNIINSLDKNQATNLEKISKKLQKIVQETRDIMKDGGLITESDYNSLTDYYENYVPLQGFDNQDIDSSSPIQKSGSVQGKETKESGGRATKADNIVANIIKQRTAAVIRAEENKALTKLYNLSNTTEGQAVVKSYSKDTLPKGTTPFMDKDYVGVKINGEQMYLKFENKELANIVNQGNVQKKDIITKFLGGLNAYLSMSLTTLNPEFGMTNFVKDIQAAFLNLESEADLNNDLNGKKIAIKATKGVFKSIRAIYRAERSKSDIGEYSKYYDEFRKHGAKTGWANQNSLEDIKKKLDNLSKMRKANKLSALGIKKGFKDSLDFVETVNTAIENGIRLSSYVEARKIGVSEDRAALLAKELTVNFNQSGSWGSVASSIFLFFNPAVQGNVRFAKATFKRKTNKDGSKSFTSSQKIAVGIIGFSAMLTTLNRALSEDDDDGKSFFSKIPDYKKERNIIIMNPKNGKDYYTIPLPYGYNIFNNIGSLSVEVATGDRSVGDGIGALTAATIGAFSPIGFGESEGNLGNVLVKGFTPTAAKPFTELNNNEDFFGNSIYNEDFFGSTPTPDATKGRKNTPAAFKNVALFLNDVTNGNEFESGGLDFAPESLYYLYKFGIGGTGKFISNSIESIDKAWKKAIGDSTVEIEYNKIPFLRRFYSEPNDYVTMEEFSDRTIKLKQKIKSREGQADHNKIKKVAKQFDEINKKLKKIRKEKKKLSKKLNSEKEIEKLEETSLKLMKKGNAIYNSRLGKHYK